MQLSQDQINTFHELGYLFLPNCFQPEEIEVLRAAAAEVYSLERDEVWRETNGVPRTAFAAHILIMKRFNAWARIRA